MNKTLSDYLKEAEHAQQQVHQFGLNMSTEELSSKVRKLQAGIKNIQTVAKQMCIVSNRINELVMYNNFTKSNDIKKISMKREDIIDPYPSAEDIATLKMMYASEERTVAPGVTVQVCNVRDVSDIPPAKIYYVTSTGQFATSIAGLVVRGNIGRISNEKSECHARCDYGTSCKSFTRPSMQDGKFVSWVKCKYYHDPEDFIKLGLKVPEDNIRNFNVSSFLYNGTDSRKRAYNTRHVGNRDSLAADLKSLRANQYKSEVSTREAQLMHDILVYVSLHKAGLIDGYPLWHRA